MEIPKGIYDENFDKDLIAIKIKCNQYDLEKFKKFKNTDWITVIVTSLYNNVNIDFCWLPNSTAVKEKQFNSNKVYEIQLGEIINESFVLNKKKMWGFYIKVQDNNQFNEFAKIFAID